MNSICHWVPKISDKCRLASKNILPPFPASEFSPEKEAAYVVLEHTPITTRCLYKNSVSIKCRWLNSLTTTQSQPSVHVGVTTHQLWGTGARAPLQFAYVHQFSSFYLCITPVGSRRRVVNTIHFHVPAIDSQ